MSQHYTAEERDLAFAALGCHPRTVQRMCDPEPVQECVRHADIWPCSHGVTVAARVLDAVAPAIAARALRAEADFIVNNMARAWGGDEMWLTTGSKAADVTAGVLREAADEIEAS